MPMNPSAKRNPWIFVPSIYFAEGLVYIIVNSVSVMMYKKMGLSNALIGLTSFLYLPWVIKMFWAPVVDGVSTKRNWVIWMQLAVSACLFLTAFAVPMPGYFKITLVLFVAAAFASATHDIATDGFYMLSLSDREQALFVGIRSLFYRLAMIFGTGFLVFMAGKIEVSQKNIPLSWSAVMAVAGAIYLILALFNKFYLPRPAADACVAGQCQKEAGIREKLPFAEAFGSYFKQAGVLPIVLFIVFYRFGEAVVVKMIQPFLIDAHSAGGLGLGTSDVGLVYGTVGITSLIIGGIAGGAIIARFGIRKCIWPFALMMNLPILFFVYMAFMKPALPWVYIMVSLEQLGYGLGMTALTVVLLNAARGHFKTSHYAISTGIMAVGMMVPGMISGYLQEWLGYYRFFMLAAILTVPGMICIFFLPFDRLEKADA
jgi:MFS transporter, PAT family, beta-lactamase induction signal transducer AmpG